MSSSKCSFTYIRGIFWPLNPSRTTVYARSEFYPSLCFTLSLQSAFLHSVCILSLVSSLPFTLTDFVSVLTAQTIRTLEKKKCHPFERLWPSVRKRIVIPSNDSGYPGVREKLSSFRTTRGYPLEIIVFLSNGSGYPFEKIVIRLNGSTSYPLKTIVSPATVPNHFFQPKSSAVMSKRRPCRLQTADCADRADCAD